MHKGTNTKECDKCNTKSCDKCELANTMTAIIGLNKDVLTRHYKGNFEILDKRTKKILFNTCEN